jgi:aryl sulfotransferase
LFRVSPYWRKSFAQIFCRHERHRDPLPQKQRELHNHHFDSTIWNDFAFRDDDIIIATYGKSGTTWVQQIVGQLLFNGAEDVSVAEFSPWLDLRVPPKLGLSPLWLDG